MDQYEVITLEDRGFIQVIGLEAKDFLQNIVTNDIEKVTLRLENFSVEFMAILSRRLDEDS